MARVVKLRDVRRSELLDCAQALFVEVGYEAATIADIIERAGVSKGGFYHHFDSKEALLEALAERITHEMVAAAEDVLNAHGLNGVERLNGFFAGIGRWKAAAGPRLRAVFEATLRRENALLHHRLIDATSRIVAPVLARIIDQGVREGIFSTPDSAVVSEILLNLAHARQPVAAAAIADLDRGETERAIAALERRVAVEEAVADRLLGAAPGSVRFVEPGFVRTALESMRSG
jgi:AcrR family transcriptional regulator